MVKVYLLLGSNLGNRGGHLANARISIERRIGKLIGKSSIFETEPWGFKHDNNFWNQVVVIETILKPGDLLPATQKIEKDIGRERTSLRYSERIIDIDILFYDDQVVNEEQLVIPHPKIQERMFVLAPLEEIAKNLIHPVLLKTIARLKDDCSDMLRVVLVNSGN